MFLHEREKEMESGKKKRKWEVVWEHGFIRGEIFRSNRD